MEEGYSERRHLDIDLNVEEETSKLLDLGLGVPSPFTSRILNMMQGYALDQGKELLLFFTTKAWLLILNQNYLISLKAVIWYSVGRFSVRILKIILLPLLLYFICCPSNIFVYLSPPPPPPFSFLVCRVNLLQIRSFVIVSLQMVW